MKYPNYGVSARLYFRILSQYFLKVYKLGFVLFLNPEDSFRNAEVAGNSGQCPSNRGVDFQFCSSKVSKIVEITIIFYDIQFLSLRITDLWIIPSPGPNRFFSIKTTHNLKR